MQLVWGSASLWISSQFKKEGVEKSVLFALGCKPWPAAGCNDRVSRKFFSCFSDHSLEQSRRLCRRAELQQLLSLPALLFAPAMAPCQQPWPHFISLLAWAHKFFLNSASTRIFLGILDRGGYKMETSLFPLHFFKCSWWVLVGCFFFPSSK